MKFELEHGFYWTAYIKLSSWKGYLDRSGAYGGPGPMQHSDGSVKLIFAPEGRDTEPLTEDELRLINWFVENEPSVSTAVKSAVFNAYSSLTDDYDYSVDEMAEYAPRIFSVDDLARLIGLYAVNVHQVEKDGMPYVGFEFGCTWDDEHSLGVLMHGDRVVEIGGADTAFLLWIAEGDAAV